MKRHWAINGRFLSQPMTGVQRYAREIIKSLDDALCDGHPLTENLEVRLVSPPGAFGAPLDLHRIELVETGKRRGHLWEQVDLPAAAPHGLVSLCNLGPIAHRRQIICIHDLNTRIVPYSYSLPFRALYRVLVPTLARTATVVSTVSNYSASQFSCFKLCDPAKLCVIPNGSEHALRWNAVHSEKTQAVAGKDTIVVLGSRAPHKNFELMLRIADDLAEIGLRLAIVGVSDAWVFAAKGHQMGVSREFRNVTWLGRISDNEFAALLRDCLCLAFPSFTEGFGLPPIEALARGCPVVVSDRASLPEVCGSAALYASPDDPRSWLRQFIRLRTEADLSARLARRGPTAAARYSWRQSAEKYLHGMAECDGIASKMDLQEKRAWNEHFHGAASQGSQTVWS
jgi:glycosyltransferase involved in cell wall biosynthesis